MSHGRPALYIFGETGKQNIDYKRGNRTETIEDLAFTSAVITVEQPVGTVVLSVTCTFGQPTSNGAVPGTRVSCSSS